MSVVEYRREARCLDCKYYVPAPKPEAWVNLFENPNPYESHNPIIAGHSLYETKAEAEKIGNLSEGYVETVKIKWEDKQ